LFVLGFVLPSSALTIGVPQGAVWLGRPLDLVLPLSMGRAETLDALCLEADMVQGDGAREAQRLAIVLEPGRSADTPRMRLRSSAVIEEPVVALTVRAGCAGVSTRRHVLLADVPEAAMVAASPRVAPARASAAASSPAATKPPPPPPRAAPASVVRRAEARPPKKQASAGGGSRLQIDTLEMLPVQQALPLRLSRAMTAPAGDAVMASAPLAAATIEAAAPMASMETAIATLRAQMTQNQQTLQVLREELAQARQSRYRNPLVHALLGLLLAMAVGMAWLWRRGRRSAAPAWWHAGGAQAAVHEPAQAAPKEDPDSDERGAHAARFAMPATVRPLAGAVGVAAAVPPAHPIDAEELLDVQQQSDFFLSLGQHDQAIAVLAEHIAAHPGTSALAYLDLLRLYHLLGRRDDYERLRQDFAQACNADVPAFADFSREGRGLEHYAQALARIESCWASPDAPALIEALLFRRPDSPQDEIFDLAAYQELLLLYAIVKESTPARTQAPLPPDHPVAAAVQALDLDLADFGPTDLQTLPQVLSATPAPAAGRVPHIDFNPFDPAVEAAITPGSTLRISAVPAMRPG